MIIPINAQYRIVSDEYQWIIQRKRTRKGKEDWQARLYYSNLKAAVEGLGELMVRQSKAVSIGGRRGGRHHALPRSGT